MNRNRNLKNRTRAGIKRKMNSIAKTVRHVRGKPTVSRTSIRKATAFQKELEGIPIYLINAHSCICLEEGECFEENPERYFEIPADTYILTYGEPGDYSCLTEIFLDYFIRNSEEIRDFLTVHSASNLRLNNSNTHSLFGDMSRAAQTTERGAEKLVYPNINYSMNPDKEGTPQTKNKYGVYRIDDPTSKLSEATINNRMSLIPQNKKRKNWFLADIIQEVYKKTGVHKGIFLNTGCLTSCSRKQPIGKHLDKAASVISLANAMYPTVRETLTQKELEKHGLYPPTNSGVWFKFSKIHPAMAKELVEKGLYKAENLLKDKELWADEENIKEFRELVKKGNN